MPKLRNVLATSTVLCLLSAAASAQTVTTLVNPPPSDGVVYGFLMTDGSVLFQGGGIYDWYKFTPDAYGSYQNGTWSSVASLPVGYGPYANSGAVLPDGRLLIAGGEYLVNKADTKLVFKLTTTSAIYDPRANSWTVFPGPRDWTAIGDSPGTVLANGRFLLGAKLTRRQALLDPKTLTWLPVQSDGKADHNAEEGWTLMPDGSILTVDVYNAPHSERYLPSSTGLTGEWISDGSTVANLKFTWTTGPDAHKIPFKHDGHTYYYKPAGEIGPALLRPDGTVFATGAINTVPVKAPEGHTAIYHPGRRATDPGTWVPGPDFQSGDDAGDEYAVLLPNGNVLVEANTNGIDESADTRARRLEHLMQTHTPMSASIRLHTAAAVSPQPAACGGNPVQIYHLYEFDGTNFPLEPVDVQTCGNSLNLLGLPSGETIVGGVGLYTSATGNPAPDWAPVVTTFPATISAGGLYKISGKRFSGLSQANAFGDEFAAPTNYPLVRVTNDATGHVFYCRTHDWTSSGVATGSKIVTTSFDVPDTVESGPGVLEVVANGIPSRSVRVTVR